MKDVLRIADLEPVELTQVLDTAAKLRRSREYAHDDLDGHLVVLYFTESSTRTRLTFAGAAERLGATVLVLGPADASHGWDASAPNVGRLASDHAAVIVARTDHLTLRRLADAAAIPVVNGLSDRDHPCQAVADLLTLRDHLGTLERRHVTYVGEADSTAHSFVEACALAGIHVTAVTPRGRDEPQQLVAATIQSPSAETGAVLRLSDDPSAAVEGVDAVYAGTLFRLDLSDGESAARRSALSPFHSVAELVYRRAPQALFMQALTSHPGDQVSPRVGRYLRLVARDQAENRHHAATALLLLATQTTTIDVRLPKSAIN